MSPVLRVSHLFISGINYSPCNSAISRSHQALGDFHVDILQYPFCKCSGNPAPVAPVTCLVGPAWAPCLQPVSDFQMRCHVGASLCKKGPPVLCRPRALPGMMQWIRSQRPGENGINIITADFVELGEFISAVISLNYHLDDDEDDATWGVVGWGGASGEHSHLQMKASASVCALILLSLAFFSGGRLQCFFHFI